MELDDPPLEEVCETKCDQWSTSVLISVFCAVNAVGFGSTKVIAESRDLKSYELSI